MNLHITHTFIDLWESRITFMINPISNYQHSKEQFELVENLCSEEWRLVAIYSDNNRENMLDWVEWYKNILFENECVYEEILMNSDGYYTKLEEDYNDYNINSNKFYIIVEKG